MKSSSTYPDGHLIRVQEMDRGLLYFLLGQLGVRGQGQGSVGVSTYTLWIKEKDGDRDKKG